MDGLTRTKGHLKHLLPDWIRAGDGAYLVGGCVRDLLIGRKPTDYDLIVLGDAPAHAQRLASKVGGRIIEIGKPAFRVWRVVTGKRIIDVAPATGGSLDRDLRRRDFTINALAIDTATGRVIDVTGGRSDLATGTIRMVSADAFGDDPLRLLRAYRLASRLDFTIDPQTRTAISCHAGLIMQSAGERIRDELFKLLVSAAAWPYLAEMQKAGLLQAIFPGIGTAAGESALQSLQKLEIILDGFAGFPADLAARLSEEFQEHRRACLKFAVLLRPMRRPHQVDVLRRLRLSKRDTARIDFLVRSPLVPHDSGPTAHVFAGSELRFFRAAAALSPDLLLLASAVSSPKTDFIENRSADPNAPVIRMLQSYFFQYRPRTLSPSPVTGHDLIREFGLQPSARFKEILDLLDEERLSRESFSRAEALDFIRAYMGDMP
jgi:tRNA nucleotidyltransferase/poly(A) polymerase